MVRWFRTRKARAGTGSRLLRAVTKAGIGWSVVRVWWGKDRTFERRLKNGKNTPQICPVCKGQKVKLRAGYWRREGVTIPTATLLIDA